MRENEKQIRKSTKSVDDKLIKYTAIGLSILAVLVFALFMYSKNLYNDVQEGTISSEEIASILDNSNDFENLNDTESTSSSIGKSIEEAQNNIEENSITSNKNQLTVVKNTTSNVTSTNANVKKENNPKNDIETKSEPEKDENIEEKKELKFEKPIDGEIIRDYTKDSLIYSPTLKEWVTHTGIDIKADKTTVVKAAESGTVKTIKNDPRFGITIVIEHSDGFQTVYSNLLTTEFVVEGENVEKGQSIGTVGNTAIFEIADESHLHFEIIKDSTQVDPNLYIN